MQQFCHPKNRQFQKGKASCSNHPFFWGVSCFNFGGVNRGLMWRAWTTWGINEVPKTSLIRVYEPIIRVYNGLYYLGFTCSMLEKITHIPPKLWFVMVMHTMGSNPQKLTNITNPAKKTSIETPGVAPNHHHLGGVNSPPSVFLLTMRWCQVNTLMAIVNHHMKVINITWYCWWLKSCTTKDDDYPIIYRVLYIPGGAGFRPSTVVTCSHGDPIDWSSYLLNWSPNNNSNHPCRVNPNPIP